MDNDSCGAEQPHNRFPAESLVERYIHYTCVLDLRQVPNQDAMPGGGLMEMGLRRRGGNGTAAVTNPSCKTGHQQQNLLALTVRIRIRRLRDGLSSDQMDEAPQVSKACL